MSWISYFQSHSIKHGKERRMIRDHLESQQHWKEAGECLRVGKFKEWLMKQGISLSPKPLSNWKIRKSIQDAWSGRWLTPCCLVKKTGVLAPQIIEGGGEKETTDSLTLDLVIPLCTLPKVGEWYTPPRSRCLWAMADISHWDSLRFRAFERLGTLLFEGRCNVWSAALY